MEEAKKDSKKEIDEYKEKVTLETEKKYQSWELSRNRLKSDLENAHKKINQGPVELQGEVQEILVEKFLRENFPQDSIEEVKKGARGADCIHNITVSDKVIGKILYESKDTKNFEEKWVKKLLNDVNEKKANVGILFTSALPKNVKKVDFRYNSQIIICHMNFETLFVLARSMRAMIENISKNKKLDSLGPEKGAEMIEFLRGPEFESLIKLIIDDNHAARKLIDDKERSDQLFYERMRTNIDSRIKNFNKLHLKLKAPKEIE